MIKLVAPGRRAAAGHTTAQRGLPTTAESCMFLDVDGTLVDFAATPAEVRIEPVIIELLGAALLKLDGALGLVSGRPIADLDRLFDPLLLPAAGIHGLERRDATGAVYRGTPPGDALTAVRGQLQALVACHSGLLLEDKHVALAVHFRQAPQEEGLVRRALAGLMHSLAPGFELLEGDKVIEIKPSSHNKASAVEAFMREAPFAGRRPIFIGDDPTDRDGFVAVERHGGVTIAVGDRVEAHFRLADPAAVRCWLASFVATVS